MAGESNPVGPGLSARANLLMEIVWSPGVRCHGFFHVSFRWRATLRRSHVERRGGDKAPPSSGTRLVRHGRMATAEARMNGICAAESFCHKIILPVFCQHSTELGCFTGIAAAARGLLCAGKRRGGDEAPPSMGSIPRSSGLGRSDALRRAGWAARGYGRPGAA